MNVDDVGQMIAYHGPTSASALHSITIPSMYENSTGCSTAFLAPMFAVVCDTVLPHPVTRWEPLSIQVVITSCLQLRQPALDGALRR